MVRDSNNRGGGNGDRPVDPGADGDAGSGDHGNQGQMTIVVNGRAKKWTKATISYDELVALSGLPLPGGPNPGFTITYHNGPDHQDSTVVTGQSVGVRNGMVFNVTPTTQS